MRRTSRCVFVSFFVENYESLASLPPCQDSLIPNSAIISNCFDRQEPLEKGPELLQQWEACVFNSYLWDEL